MAPDIGPLATTLASYIEARLTYHPERGFWGLADGRHIEYHSDPVARHELAPLLRATRDLSATSAELEYHAATWPASYYLSARRSNILRAFDWTNMNVVLEIGAGCGTITRYLAETCTRVIAVEGDPLRASLAASRLRDLPNVAVVCAPYDALPFRGTFDAIFSIGVLEYAHLYSSAFDPFHAVLSTLRNALADDGDLVVAIENQMGLKYFAGAAEDHTGIRFDGIEGYRRSGAGGPRTLGRRALLSELTKAGFGDSEFFYPFPDYKFAKSLIAGRVAHRTDVDLSGLVGQDPGGDYLAGTSNLAFDTAATWSVACKNGLLPDLANSFLVVASASEKPSRHFAYHWDAVAFSMAPRARPYWTRTDFVGLGTAAATAHRRRMFPELPVSAAMKVRDEYVEPWHTGRSLAARVSDVLAHPLVTPDEAAAALRPWTVWLQTQVDERDHVSGDLLDAIPRNVIARQGDLHFFDHEIGWQNTIPLDVLVARGLFHTLGDAMADHHGPPFVRRRGIGLAIIQLARLLRIDGFGYRTLSAFCVMESRLQADMGIASAPSHRRFLRLMFGGLTPPAARTTARRIFVLNRSLQRKLAPQRRG